MYSEKGNSILKMLKDKNFMSVSDIVEALKISPSTVRRELTLLEKKGLVTRTHGGVKIKDSNNYVPNFALRIHQNVFEKKLIALKAISLIKDGDVVFLDGSTSTYFMAEYLFEFPNIKVITNGIDTLSLLSHNNVEAYSTGGCVSKDNSSVLVGEQTIEFIKKIKANICFFSCQSINKNGEISDCYLQDNYIRKQMIENSFTSVMLCDSGKFDRDSSFYLCNVNKIDYLITDKNIDNYFNNEINTKIIY